MIFRTQWECKSTEFTGAMSMQVHYVASAMILGLYEYRDHTSAVSVKVQ